MTPIAWLVIAVAGLVLTALTGIAVKALHHFPRHELEEICRREKRPELFDEILDSHEEIAVGVESLRWAAALLAVLAGCAAWIAEHPAEPITIGVFFGGLGLAFLTVLVLAVWIPWAVVDLWAAPFVFYTWRLWWVAGRLTTPLRFGVWLFDAIFRRLSGRRESDQGDDEEAFVEEIRSMVTEGHRDGLLEADARQMIERVIDLGDADAADVMMPRSSINAMSIDLSWQEMLRFVVDCRRTRIPVYEQTLDRIVGILYVKDLLPELAHASDRRRPLREVLRRPYFIPETMRLDLLLREFLRTHTHIAIVLDEYKGVAGLVTLEDLLEEIVGEIVDESDRALVRTIETIDDHTAEVMARTHVGELNEALNLDLPEDDEEYDTVGGFVVRKLGRIPQPGEVVTWDGGRIVVVKANRRGVERVRIERNKPAA